MESKTFSHSDLWNDTTNTGNTIVGAKYSATVTGREIDGNGKKRYTVIVDGVTYTDLSRSQVCTKVNGGKQRSGSAKKNTLTIPVSYEQYLDLRIKKIEQNADAMIALAVNDEMKTLLLGQKAIMVQTESDKATKDWAERQKNIEAYNDYQAKYDAEEKRIIKLIRAGEFDSIKFDDIKTLRANMDNVKSKL